MRLILHDVELGGCHKYLVHQLLPQHLLDQHHTSSKSFSLYNLELHDLNEAQLHQVVNQYFSLRQHYVELV